MTTDPPFDEGAAKETVACAFPAIAFTAVGAPGIVMTTGATGVTALEATDTDPVPAEFVAFTVNVYDVPFARPVTVIGLALPEAVWPPDDVTVYEVIDAPPFDEGAVNETVACAFPAVTETLEGAPGTFTIATGGTGFETAAVTVTVAVAVATAAALFPAHVIEYVVTRSGQTVADPATPEVLVKPFAVHRVAFVEYHVRSEEFPIVTFPGFAINVTVGAEVVATTGGVVVAIGGTATGGVVVATGAVGE